MALEKFDLWQKAGTFEGMNFKNFQLQFKNKLCLGFLFFATIIQHLVLAQSAKDVAVEVFVTTQIAPPKITLNWVNNSTTTGYRVAKKLPGQPWPAVNFWTSLPGSSSQFVDTNVSAGVIYEYHIERAASNYFGIGHVSAGIKLPEVHHRGKLILLIAENLADSLSFEIQRLKEDMEGDGWEVKKHVVLDTTRVPAVKNIIRSLYLADTVNTKSVFIIGHIAVPYSGNFAVDNHADHRGAWPADVFYADMDGVWTDISVNTTNGPARIHNIPGDGKYDQNTIVDAELEVGRLDLSRMPAFSQSEIQLTRNYLNKNHAYRKKEFTAIKRAVIDDNFGYFGEEAFASGAFRNFAALVGPQNVVQGDYLTSMANGQSYLWSYGCGGGSFTNVSGVASTNNFATSNLGGVFTMLFGSYFGDWDVPNNVLRAPLCQGKTLTNAWSGRPYWILHWMGLGYTMGHSTKLTQNNNRDYWANWGYRLIHMALMGDPTLRNDVVSPVSNVVAERNGFHVDLSWAASTQANVLGYNVYWKSRNQGKYTRLNDSLVTSLNFNHQCLPDSGIYQYMVRAMVLETTPSGSYYNMSEGVADTVFMPTSLSLLATASATLQPNSSTVNFNASARLGSDFLWEFGDDSTSLEQNPVHTYLTTGDYEPRVIVRNDCVSDTINLLVSITRITHVSHSSVSSQFKIFPNPSDGRFSITSNQNMHGARLEVSNSQGQNIFKKNLNEFRTEVNLSLYPKGIFGIQIVTKYGDRFLRKVILE